MGVWGKDIKGVKDLNNTLRTWEDLKIWSSEKVKDQKNISQRLRRGTKDTKTVWRKKSN